jgi:hypothetical protein
MRAALVQRASACRPISVAAPMPIVSKLLFRSARAEPGREIGESYGFVVRPAVVTVLAVERSRTVRLGNGLSVEPCMKSHDRWTPPASRSSLLCDPLEYPDSVQTVVGAIAEHRSVGPSAGDWCGLGGRFC